MKIVTWPNYLLVIIFIFPGFSSNVASQRWKVDYFLTFFHKSNCMRKEMQFPTDSNSLLSTFFFFLFETLDGLKTSSSNFVWWEWCSRYCEDYVHRRFIIMWSKWPSYVQSFNWHHSIFWFHMVWVGHCLSVICRGHLGWFRHRWSVFEVTHMSKT